MAADTQGDADAVAAGICPHDPDDSALAVPAPQAAGSRFWSCAGLHRVCSGLFAAGEVDVDAACNVYVACLRSDDVSRIARGGTITEIMNVEGSVPVHNRMCGARWDRTVGAPVRRTPSDVSCG